MRIRVALFFLTLGNLISPSLAQVDGRIVQGITLSTHGNGRDWGSESIRPTLESIRAVGANWIAIHPYASLSEDGSLRFARFSPDHPPAYLEKPIREAHRLGLKICIKPHIAYWGSPFSWRGEIEFSGEDAWSRFWRDYRAWIALLAEVCSEADGFVVGTELDRTLHFEDQWRALIAEVRTRTKAPLTYAANWTDYQRVPFWDALDVIGIQAYFPLTERRPPSREDIQRGWQQRMAEIRTYAEPLNRQVLFTELGYNQSHKAAMAPWDYEVDGEDARPVQIACMQTALEAIAREERVVGALLWKWFPHPQPVGRNFQLAAPHMLSAIAKQWQSP